MQSVVQRSFAGGELSPDMYGRSDVQKYATGVKTCRNFMVKRSGAATNRPGFQFVCEVKTSAKSTRLIKFQFNSSQTYVLEFGDQYMRVIQNGVLLESGGSPYEISTPYLEADLFNLKYDQSGDVITITHPSYEPRELSRTGHTSWTLSTVTFAPAIGSPTGVGVTKGGSGSNSYSYRVTAIEQETYIESIQSSAADATSAAAPTSSNPHVVTWTAATGAVEYRIYKALNGVYGYIGTAQGTSFDDTGLSADISETPPIENDPFSGADDYPGTCSYYQQRHCFGRTNNDPEKVWATRTGDYKNMTLRSPLKADDSLSFNVPGRDVNEVMHLIDIGKLVIFTTGGVVIAMGDSAGAIQPGEIYPRQQSYYGSSSVRPVVVGDTILYVQARSTTIRDLRYQLESDGYTGDDLTVYANHLFDGHTIVDFAYQQIPNSIVWAVRDDGVLLGLTYIREHQIWGWHQHTTVNGEFESITVVSEGNEDVLYAVVKRTIDGSTVRYIERIATRFISDIEDAFFVDSGLSYDGTNATATTMTLSGGTDWTYGETLTLTASTSFFSAGDVGNAIVLTSGSDTITATITAYTSGTVVSVTPNKTVPASLRSTAVATWSKAVDELSGLDHLEGETVNILADGRVHAQRTVSSGAITLERPAAKAHVGLPITADIETLSLDQPQGAVIVNRLKNIERVNLLVNESLGGWCGPDVNNLTEFKYELNADLQTTTLEIDIVGSMTKTGSVVVRQLDPLPMTILGIVLSGSISD